MSWKIHEIIDNILPGRHPYIHARAVILNEFSETRNSRRVFRVPFRPWETLGNKLSNGRDIGLRALAKEPGGLLHQLELTVLHLLSRSLEVEGKGASLHDSFFNFRFQFIILNTIQ
jgi:hypothetical protein